MRILLLWTLYDEYIHYFYTKRPGLAEASYSEQQAVLYNDFFGIPGSLVKAFCALGHEAEVIYVNVKPLQAAWARAHNIPFDAERWRKELPLLQIRASQPDVLFMGAIFDYWGMFLEKVRDDCGKIFLWVASPLPPKLEVGPVECILTPLPHFVEHFRIRGYVSDLFQYACFDPAILEALPSQPRDLPVTFIGSLSLGSHRYRVDALSHVSKRIPLHVWGKGAGSWPRHPRRALNHLRGLIKLIPISKHHQGEVYGLDFFKAMARSRITLNAHIDIAEGVAANMRLFEATGCGAMLITEQSPSLAQIFEPGREIVAFQDKADLIEKIEYYLLHEDERRAIAKAGQQRTLTCHNSQVRAHELITVFDSFPAWNKRKINGQTDNTLNA